MRVLAVSSPIYAHTVNAVPFVVGLQQRGIQVDRAVATPFVGTGGSVPGGRWDTGPVADFASSQGALREVSRRYAWLLEDAGRRLPAILELIESLRPDVVLTDSLGYAAALAAERLALPWVTFGDGPLHHPDEWTPPFGAGLPYRRERPWVWRNQVIQAASRGLIMRTAQRTYAEVRAGLGLPPTATPVLEAALSQHLHLHCGAPELEYPRQSLPRHVHFVGALRPPSPGSWEPPDWWDAVVGTGGDGGTGGTGGTSATGLVLGTQGTLRADPAEVLAPTAVALSRLGLPGILTTGAGDPALLGGPGLLGRPGGPGPGGPGPAGPGRVAVEAFVPYEAVLPHTSVFVTNGGWTGVLLALAHGVPVVQVGRTEEKADIGRRVEWAGAGVHLPSPGRGTDPRPLIRALEAVSTDPAYRRAASGIAASLAGRDPGRDGAALIEACASRGIG